MRRPGARSSAPAQHTVRAADREAEPAARRGHRRREPRSRSTTRRGAASRRPGYDARRRAARRARARRAQDRQPAHRRHDPRRHRRAAPDARGAPRSRRRARSTSRWSGSTSSCRGVDAARVRDHRGQRAPGPRQPRAAAHRRALHRPAVPRRRATARASDAAPRQARDGAANPTREAAVRMRRMQKLPIDIDYVRMLLEPARDPEPDRLHRQHRAPRRPGAGVSSGIPFELTRRGAIRADIDGERKSPDRARSWRTSTRSARWSRASSPTAGSAGADRHAGPSRFAEGARVTRVHGRRGTTRGTILPLKASGHTFDEEIDTQPVAGTTSRCAIDERVCDTPSDLERPRRPRRRLRGRRSRGRSSPRAASSTRATSTTRPASRRCSAAQAKALREHGVELPVDCHLLFTITEEVGSGASAVLHGDVAEMVSDRQRHAGARPELDGVRRHGRDDGLQPGPSTTT